MPRLAIDYSKTVIYKIVCNDLSITDCYVGQTTDFTRRKQAHKYGCTDENGKGYSFKVYKTIREIGGWDNWTMVEIEKYPCKDANEARAKERYWFERLNSTLNMISPQRSEEDNKQHRITHREAKRESDKKNYQKYRDAISLKGREVVICQCGQQTTYHNKNGYHLKTKYHLQYMNTVMLATDSTMPIIDSQSKSAVELIST